MKTKAIGETKCAHEAIRKAHLAACLLARAKALLVDASKDATVASGALDYRHFADAVSEIISCDAGEAGLGPFLDKMSATWKFREVIRFPKG